QDEAEHGKGADQENEVGDQREIRDQTRKSVIDEHAYERDGESHQASDDAGANRIQAEGGRNAALFFNADRSLQRVLQYTGQPARFFLIKFPGDDGVASVDRIANDRSGLDHAIENNCKPVSFVLFRDLAELLRSVAVELQLHSPTFVPKIGVRLAHTVASEVGFLFHQQTFHPRLFVFL